MIAIVRPEAIAAIIASTNNANSANMLTAPPREVWLAASATTHHIDLDLGVALPIDTIFIGSTNAASGATITVSRGTGMGAGLTGEGTVALRLTGAEGPRYSGIFMRAAGAPAARYFRITITLPTAAPLEVGIVAAGSSFRRQVAYPTSRVAIDTSSRVDLWDGGFGVGEGVTKAGYRFKFIDLDKAGRDMLWSLVSKRGNRKPVIVVEDDEELPLDDAAVHYGLLDRFEPWERANAADTVWAMGMTEWL